MKTDPNNPYEVFSEQKNGHLKSFTDELMKMKGEICELYIGDKGEEVKYDDYSVPYNCSVFGKIVDVLDRFIIIECLYLDKNTREVKTGNKIYLNSFQIRAFTLLDNKGTLQDIFMNCRDANTMRKMLLNMHGKQK